MGDRFWGLREACGNLADSRITVRKKGEGSLRDLLNNDTIISLLDSAGSDSSDMSWRQVYSSVLTFFKHEVEKIRADESKDKQSKNAESLRLNRRREIMALYSLVIRKAEKGLKWAKVVENILELLGNENFKKMFVDDFVRLLTSIVSHPKRQIFLGVSGMEEGHQWNTILETVINLICEAPENLDILTAIKLLHATVLHGPRLCDLTQCLYTPRFLQLLTTLLTASSNSFRSGSPAKLEAIKLATLFCTNACYDLRREMCKLGEDTLHCVIPSWEDKRQNTNPVIDFIKIQLIIHHPGGARDETEGALICDKEDWLHQLHRVQQNIVLTTISNKMRQNKTRGSLQSADYELSTDLLDLAVRVYCQTLTANQEDLIDITQMVNMDTTQAEMNGTAAKRLRLDKTIHDQTQLDVSIIGFLAKIQTPVENDLTKIPWLQILSGLLVHSPKILRNPDLEQHILLVLSNLLQTTKATATKRHCLTACLKLLHHTSYDDRSSGGFLILPEWETVVRVTLNLVSMNQADKNVHSLLQEILKGPKGKTLRGQVFSLYENQLIRHAEETFSTLLYLLNSQSLSLSMRISIINWIWQDLDEGRDARDGFLNDILVLFTF